MTAPRRFLDVWILESNTVYREVPFTVVADWVQQGRLLEDDMLRPSGTAEWMKVGSSPTFSPYLPKAVPIGAEDQAEAMEPVAMDFAWKRPREDEDDDVDMIPLIDVSLVLLIFFMLTASSVGASMFVPTPETDYGLMADNPKALRIDIGWVNGAPLYAIADGETPAAKENSDLRTLQEVLERLKARCERITEPTELVINAHKDTKAKYTREVLTEVRKDAVLREKLTANYFGVSERQP